MITKLLHDQAGLQIKLQAIGAAGQRICSRCLSVLDWVSAGRYLEALAGRAAVLAQDKEALTRVAGDLTQFESEARAELTGQLAKLDHRLRDMVDRGDLFFEQQLQWTKLPELLLSDGHKLQAQFEKQAADTTTGCGLWGRRCWQTQLSRSIRMCTS